jgi:hypothetical protein
LAKTKEAIVWGNSREDPTVLVMSTLPTMMPMRMRYPAWLAGELELGLHSQPYGMRTRNSDEKHFGLRKNITIQSQHAPWACRSPRINPPPPAAAAAGRPTILFQF